MLYILAPAVPTDTHLQQQTNISSKLLQTAQQPHYSLYAVNSSTSSQRRHSDTYIHHLLQFVFVSTRWAHQRLAPRRSTGEIYDTV
jgi:hypothetical protein